MRVAFSIIPIFVLCSCAKESAGIVSTTVIPTELPLESTNVQDDIRKMQDYVQSGITIPVQITPIGVDTFPGELENLKNRFLVPISKSPYSTKIEKIIIDASQLEWAQWTCRIELKEYMNPITITHFGGLYDGESNQDKDGYRRSRPYVLSELDKIAKRVGWDKSQGEQAAPRNR